MKQDELRIAALNLGCKTNRYETDAVVQDFLNQGYREVSFRSEADLYIINTCSVTGEAGRKSGQMVRRARKMNPEAVVVAMGCHVELGAESLGADILVGNTGKTRVPALLAQWTEMNQGREMPERLNFRAIAGSLNSEREPDFEEFSPQVVQSESRGIIKIQDGCNNFCTYCTIPMARGRVRSRGKEQILQEVRNLAGYGFSEMVLTGIHICSYGQEREEDSEPVEDAPLIGLLADIAEIPGVKRLRLGSVEPKSVTEAFAGRLATIPGICPHIHLSLQSGSDRTLARMNRRYNTDDYRTAVRYLRASLPGLNLTTDVIVGFPGETGEDHESSLAFASEMGFGRIHVFRYSPREGTAAASFREQVAPDVAARRSEDFQALGEKLLTKRQEALVGSRAEILLESKLRDGSWLGYTAAYDVSRVYFDDMIPMDAIREGDIWPVSVTAYRGDELICNALTGED